MNLREGKIKLQKEYILCTGQKNVDSIEAQWDTKVGICMDNKST